MTLEVCESSGCLALLIYKIRTRKEFRVCMKHGPNLRLLAQWCGRDSPTCLPLSSVLQDVASPSLSSASPTSTIQKHPSPQGKDPKAIRGSSSDAAHLPWLTVSPDIPRKLEQAQVSAWAQSCVGLASYCATQVPQNLMHHQHFFLQSPQPASCTTQPPQDQGALLEGGPWTLEM